jgi:hypothetical protein
MYNFSIACQAQDLPKAIKKITDLQIVELTMNHDCKLSPDDGCDTCEEIYKLKEFLNKSL